MAHIRHAQHTKLHHHEYANAEEQFSTDPKPEEHSPYSVYQSSFQPKMPQKSFVPPNTLETLSESTKQMIIEHNKKVKLNNPTPYPSGSKTKPNPTLGKPTPAPQQVHQHSQDEPCDDLDPTDTPSAVPTALQAPSDDTYNPKCTPSLMETQCNHSQYPILMKKICTHDPSTNQVSKRYNPHPVTFPYPPDPGEHVLETSSAPTTLVERDKLDLSSLIPPKGEMKSSFSWTCPFKSPTSSTLCFGERTLGKINQETDVYMTKHMPKPSSGANRVSVSHSSLVTKNGEHFYGENFIHDFPKSWKHIKEVDWGDQLKLNYTTHGYMLMEIDWGGKFNYTSCGYPMANWQLKVMKTTLLDTRPQKLIGEVMTLMDLITLHPCPSSILMTYWGEPSSYLWMRMGRERAPPFLSMSWISVNNKSQEKISSDSSSRLMQTNLMISFHITNLWNT